MFKTKISKAVRWTLWNSFLAANLYFAIVEAKLGCANVFIFVTYAALLMTMLCATNNVINSVASKAEEPIHSSVPWYINIAFDMTVTYVLIYNAWWITGVAYMLHAILVSYIWFQLRTKSQEMLLARISGTQTDEEDN